ncbi:hypothetical protein [Paenibacillus marinisediminis]
MNDYRSFSSSDDKNDPFMNERLRELERMQRDSRRNPNWQGDPNAPYYHVQEPPFMNQKPPRKSKFVAVMLSALFPGLGHFYLGLMQRGLLMMMLLALDIVAIVYFTSNMGANVPLIVLLSLLMPVIYFFNLFDTMQHTDKVNTQTLYGTTGTVRQGPWLGILLVLIGIMLLLFAFDPSWLRWLFNDAGSFLGALLLIIGGLFVLFKESRKKP